MSLLKELKIASVVVVARNFNPSIFTQQWLISKNVIEDRTDDGQQIFTPQFVHITNNNFHLTVLPEQLIFEVINSPKETFVACVIEKLIPIVNALNETPFAAVGINFQWHMTDSEQTVTIISKRLFDKGDGIYSEFNTADARYGAYMSKNFLNARLKLDIKPFTEQQQNDGNSPQEFIMSAFNFHKDLFSLEKQKELLEMIQNSKLFLDESEKIVNKL